jgi:hypothetical protein
MRAPSQDIVSVMLSSAVNRNETFAARRREAPAEGCDPVNFFSDSLRLQVLAA